MEGFSTKIKLTLVKEIQNVKQDQLDKPYIASSNDMWTRREITKEIDFMVYHKHDKDGKIINLSANHKPSDILVVFFRKYKENK